MDEFPKQNTGLLEGKRPEDYVAGTLTYEPRNPSGDWRDYLPKEEKQYSDNVDTMACVSFSANNCLEIQHKQQTGSEVNFSDRFLAKMSGTTHEGNYLYKVADTIRNVGLVSEEEWPTPSNYTWASYYSEILQEVINKAQKFDVGYEWVAPQKSELQYHLRHAPIQITIPLPYPNHAVVLVHIEGDTAYYFDTYPPYLKTMSISKISSALKLIGTFQKYMQLVNDKGTIYIIAGSNDKRKIGIADEETLGLFGDEPQVQMDTSNIPQYQTISKGFVIHNK